jgi:hypothetical protein
MNIAGKLKIGGITGLDTAIDGLTNLSNAYKIAYDDTKQLNLISDALFTGMKFGKTTVDDLSKNLGKVAPIASAMNIPFEQLIASVSAITTQGVKTTEAITQMNWLQTAGFNLQGTFDEDNAERMGDYIEQLRTHIRNGVVTEDQLSEFKGNMDDFWDLFNTTIDDTNPFLGDSGELAKFDKRINNINKAIGGLQSKKSFIQAGLEFDLKTPITTEQVALINDFKSALADIDMSTLSKDLQLALQDGSILDDFKTQLADSVAKGYINTDMATNIYNTFKDKLNSAMKDGLNTTEIEDIWKNFGDVLGKAGGDKFSEAFKLNIIEGLATDEEVRGLARLASLGRINDYNDLLDKLFKKYFGGAATGGLIDSQSIMKSIYPTDTIPMMLTPGEFVINREAVEKLGMANIDYMNKHKKLPPSMAMEERYIGDDFAKRYAKRKYTDSLTDGYFSGKTINTVNQADNKKTVNQTFYINGKQKGTKLSKGQLLQMLSEALSE